MLPKQYRLKKNSEFIATYAQKKYVSSNYFILNIGKQKPFSDYVTKVAFVVSKKIDKRAVKRNCIKRRMRAAFWEVLKNNEYKLPYMSLIFSAKKACLDIDYKIIKTELKNIIEKANSKHA